MPEDMTTAFIKEEGYRLNILGITSIPRYYTHRASFFIDKEFRTVMFYGDTLHLARNYAAEGYNPLRNTVESIEAAYGCRVYATIYNRYEELGDMLTLLTISSDESEWEQEREDLKAMQPIAYVHNFTYPEFSEWGSVLLRMNGNVLERIG